MSDLEQVLERLAELLRRLDPRPQADDRSDRSAVVAPPEQQPAARHAEEHRRAS